MTEVMRAAVVVAGAMTERVRSTSLTMAEALRALREARGLTQDGWAARLEVGRTTVQRWERGEAVPSAAIEQAIIAYCREQGLFRAFDRGPFRGLTLTAGWLQDRFAEARLEESSAIREPAVTPMARLVARGPSGSGAAHPLGPVLMTIGRAQDNVLIVGSHKVSRYHAEIRWDGTRYLLGDRGSKNGTFLNGDRVQEPTPLFAGDVVGLAADPDLAFVFELREDTVSVAFDRPPKETSPFTS
jgi:DNA-binding transcriptional regulator YiaG